MNKESEKIRNKFDLKLKQLIAQYGELVDENRRLRADLERAILKRDEMLAEAKALREANTTLKTAKMLAIANEDMRETKAKLTKLIHEVNQCIAMLKSESE